MNNKRQECIIYSRVVGWFAPIQNWNKGKIAEYKDRKVYEIKQKQDEPRRQTDIN